jgi:hypothetical protein
MAPGPRRLLEGLRDLNYTEWSLVMEKLRGPIRVAITAYMANLEGYIRDRQTDRAYYERAEKAKQKLYPKKRA